MSIKIINLTIPSNENIPDEISTFSPEENLKMIKIGCECLLEGRKAIAGLTQQEIYNKIKDESKEAVKKMELDILVERELSKKMEERPDCFTIYSGLPRDLFYSILYGYKNDLSKNK